MLRETDKKKEEKKEAKAQSLNQLKMPRKKTPTWTKNEKCQYIVKTNR